MNKKGQVLAFFIIIIPILLLLLGGIIEISIISYEKSKIYSVTRTIIASTIEEKNKNDIIKLYDDNNIKYENIDIDTTDGLKITLDTKIESFLGKIINKDNYKLKVTLIGYKENNNIKYKKG